MLEFLTKEKPVKTKKVSIETIHQEFDESSESILEEARQILQVETTKDESIYIEISKLGFGNSANVEKIRKIADRKKDLEKNSSIILYYKEKYPEYKFILKNQVDEICKKYNLAQVPPSKFKGNIPISNAKDILAFQEKIDIEDKIINHWRAGLCDFPEYKRYYQLKDDSEFAKKSFLNEPSLRVVCTPDLVSLSWDESLSEYGEIMVTDPDPVILSYVKGGFLIVTKWGSEADMEEFK